VECEGVDMEFPVYLVDGDNYLDRRNFPINTVVPKQYEGWRYVYRCIVGILIT
jgi:hypothetical protein